MNATSAQDKFNPGALFWALIGIGILAILIAAGWRVATGAELEAKGKEWSLKVTDAANKLDEVRKQLEAELKRYQNDLETRDAFWEAEVQAAREACPVPTSMSHVSPPIPAIEIHKSENALKEVAKTAESARAIARDVGKIRLPKLKF